jgi:DNA-binding HxlR family transcriptional regulator
MKSAPTHLTPGCPVRTALEMLGGKWRLLILRSLASGPLRYGQLRQQLPELSEKMLAQELKNLVDADLLVRRNYGEVPPRVDYALAPRGELALPVLEALLNFGLAYVEGPPHAV